MSVSLCVFCVILAWYVVSSVGIYICTNLPVKDHLVSFSVLDLVVQVLRQLQTLVYLGFKPNSALEIQRVWVQVNYTHQALNP